jgi:hypothetical protein
MRADAVGLVADDEVNIVDTSVNQGIQDVFENWPSSGRQHRLGPVCGQWTESNTLTSSQHDR